jgi:hypothetical protein
LQEICVLAAVGGVSTALDARVSMLSQKLVQGVSRRKLLAGTTKATPASSAQQQQQRNTATAASGGFSSARTCLHYEFRIISVTALQSS